MLKYAFMIGIAAEWLFGPPADSLGAIGAAALRALAAMLLAWMSLEALRVPVRAVDTLDPVSRAERLAMRSGAADDERVAS